MVSIGAILTSFTQQTFNDALYSLEQAKKLDKNATPFEYWKYCAWSIVASAIAMESYLADHIRTIKDDMDESLWRSYDRASNAIIGSRGIYSKITFIELVTDYKIMDDNDYDWNNIKNAIKLRNDIVHYRKTGILNSINDLNGDNGIKACRDLIKKIHIAILGNTQFPKWIDKQQSENYDTPQN